jgi:serine/threonine-protein kinase
VAPETDLTALPKPETRPPLVRPVGPKHAPAAAHGLVALRVNPWARVSVNGRDLGVTPLPPLELPAGVQVLTLTNPQLGVTRKVKLTVRPGATTPLKVDLFEP